MKPINIPFPKITLNHTTCLNTHELNREMNTQICIGNNNIVYMYVYLPRIPI